MVLRSVTSCPALPAEIAGPLAEILERSQRAVRARTRLRRDVAWWDVAETWAARELDRRDLGLNVPGGSRVLLAITVAAQLTPRGAAAWSEALAIGDSFFEDTMDLLASGAMTAYRALRDPGRGDEDFADAWIASCGVALLDVLAGASAGAAGLDGPPAAIRIARRTVMGGLALRPPVSESRQARLACVDRRTMAAWREYGAPSPDNAGFLLTAPECAEFAGVTARCWRRLSAGGHAPASRARRGPTAMWDEAEVLGWVADHGPGAS